MGLIPSNLDLIFNIIKLIYKLMKKVLFATLMSLFLCTTMNAQILRSEELEKYA